ncbi:TrmH family RNA methyltransferase [Labilibacter marinus]|uniref:TrmH family RNA methyltransferase n=1 Tax=Labilibacter marinus TaxID=1477105 RepID=UPI00094FF5A2|nr:RNA methyltransferase [Labilibacter marinus]
MKEELVKFLSEHVTENRNELFDKVLKDRTRYLTVVLEDIYQSHNASAVLRSCDCFGIQDVHIIENRNKYNINKDVALGSSKWLSLSKYNTEENNTRTALRKLKADGYRIVATTPHTNDIELYDFDVSAGKTAVVFGTELTGISDVVKEEADEFLRIPMYGFTESFNISVSAALVLQHLAHEIRNKNVSWELPIEDGLEIKRQWLNTTIKSAELIEREFYNKKNK